MKNFKLTVNNVKYFVQEVYRLLKSQCEYEVNITEWSDERTLSANAQQWVWYNQIGQEYGVTGVEISRSCKLDFGLAILLGDKKYGQQVNFILDKIGFWSFTRGQQLKAIDLIQVTSLFNTKQHNIYRENIQNHYGQLGIILEYKTKK